MADTNKLEKNEITKVILDGRREFIFEDEDGNTTSYYIANLTGDDVRKSEWQYAKVFNSALVEGLPTQSQMRDVLTQRGIISDEYARKLEKAKLDLAAALFRLENTNLDRNDEDVELVALETSRLRDEFFALNQRVNGPMSQTCENIAIDSRNEYITSRVVEKKDGTKLWPKFEDYLKEEDHRLVMKCRFEVMAWLNGMESDFLDKMPEQSALRKVAERRLESTLARFQEQAQAAADATKPVEDLELPAEEPKAVKPKRGRKKKATEE